ncbi:MAG TPA: glycosyltransferase family 2 protein [Bacteroidales bacterium]|nr:glycosyltransferase family 2 protein [Bacteroidales bacterium]
MKIVSITPVLNEEFFIENFILNNSKYVDEMIISDGGSIDKTVTIIQKYINQGFNIRLVHHVQGKPYTDEFHQDICLNNMIDTAKDADYIIQLDADEELLNTHSILKPLIELYPEINLFGLPLITFWGNRNNVRVNVENDMHWYPTPKYCIFKNIPEIRFNNPHHSFLTYNNDNIFKYGSKVIELPFYHLHYLSVKENDNRLADVGGDYKNPNWNLKEGCWNDNRFDYTGKYKIEVINIDKLYFNIAEAVYNTILPALKYKDEEKKVLNKTIDIKNNEIKNLQKQLSTGIFIKNNEINNLRIQLEEAITELKNKQISITVLKEKLEALKNEKNISPNL